MMIACMRGCYRGEKSVYGSSSVIFIDYKLQPKLL